MIREGTHVKWAWGSGHAKGTVTERHDESVTRTIDGTEVTRRGDSENPALVIEQDDGQIVLKSLAEVERADD